jgi:hypothetical protein
VGSAPSIQPNRDGLATAAQAASLPQSPASPGSLRVAVYELQVAGVPPRVGRIVTDALTSELRKLRGVNAIGMDEIRTLLAHEASKQLMGCEQESCLAEIAGALGVDELVTGSLARVGLTSVLSVRRLDVKRARAVGSIEQRLTPADGEEFLAAIGPAVESLYPDHAMLPSTTRGVADEVALDLNPPPLPLWVFATTAGGGALLAVAGLAATVAAGLSYATYNDLAAGSVPPGDAVSNAELQELERAARGWDVARLVLYGSAGLVAVAAVVEVFFTDWLDRQSRGERE